MAKADDQNDEAGEKGGVRRLIARVIISAVLLMVVGGGIYMLVGEDGGAPRKPPEIVQVRIVPPPPPPPPPTPPPPPEQPPPEQKVIEQPPDKPEPVEEAKPEEPPAGPLGLDAKGDGPPDGFGLRANPGGRGLVGAGGGAGSRWGWYATIVQSQIEAALRAHPKTRNASMQIQVRLWSDSSGRIKRVQLVTSTGDGALDAVLRDEVLNGLMLRQPPPKDMPMPIVMRITERKSG